MLLRRSGQNTLEKAKSRTLKYEDQLLNVKNRYSNFQNDLRYRSSIYILLDALRDNYVPAFLEL